MAPILDAPEEYAFPFLEYVAKIKKYIDHEDKNANPETNVKQVNADIFQV